MNDRVYVSSSGSDEKRMLGKELKISMECIFNLQSNIIKR